MFRVSQSNLCARLGQQWFVIIRKRHPCPQRLGLNQRIGEYHDEVIAVQLIGREQRLGQQIGPGQHFPQRPGKKPRRVIGHHHRKHYRLLRYLP